MKTSVINNYSISFVMVVVWLAGACAPDEAPKPKRDRKPAPVQVAPIETGELEAFRVFSASLEADASFVVSSKISGRVKEITVDMGDVVTPGMVVARIDDLEYRQSLEQARADLLVANANLNEARSLIEIARRTLERTKSLRERGVMSEAELDSVQSDYLAKEARVAVLEAQAVRAKSTLQQIKIQLGYAKVDAVWNGDGTERVVAERFVDEGAIVNANTPLLRIVDLSPVVAVFYVPEKDYGSLQVGQKVSIATDAFPGKPDTGEISRIAPIFQDSSRQARVEVRIPNDDQHLKPGMYVRATVRVNTVSQATIVPADAIVTREDVQGVFVVGPGAAVARWRPVSLGIRREDKVEVEGNGLQGMVVVLGQQLIEDGSRVSYSPPRNARATAPAQATQEP